MKNTEIDIESKIAKSLAAVHTHTHTHTHTHYLLNKIKNKKQAFLNALLNMGEVGILSISPFRAFLTADCNTT